MVVPSGAARAMASVPTLPAGAAAVLDDELLAGDLRHLGAPDARQDVGAAAGREDADEAHRARRARACRAAARERRRGRAPRRRRRGPAPFSGAKQRRPPVRTGCSRPWMSSLAPGFCAGLPARWHERATRREAPRCRSRASAKRPPCVTEPNVEWRSAGCHVSRAPCPSASSKTSLDPVAPPGRPAARLLGAPVPEAPPPHTLLGFYWHFIGQARGLFAALFFAGLLVALVDAAIPTMIGRLVALLDDPCAGPALGRGLAAACSAWRRSCCFGRPLALLLQNLITQQGINANVTSHDPLAEPLARRPPGPALLPGGFRRPHRQPGDAGRAGAARERGAGGQRRLVHPGLRHGGAAAAGATPIGGWPCRSPPGSRSTPCCCASSCRGCASARARPRRSAARSPAGSSTATPTSRP